MNTDSFEKGQAMSEETIFKDLNNGSKIENTRVLWWAWL